MINSGAGHSQVVGVRGEIDLSNAATAGRDLAASIGEGRFALDLNGVTFIDSAGLRMLNDLTRRFRRGPNSRPGCRRPPGDRVRRTG